MRASKLFFFATTITFASAGCSYEIEDIDMMSQEQTETRTVQLRLAAFIPCDGIDTFGIYDGDGRDFGYDAAAVSSRMLLDVTVDPDAPSTWSGKAFPSKSFEGSAVTTRDGWCVGLNPNARPKKQATADAKRITAEFSNAPDWQGHKVISVRLDVHGKNPLVWLSPNADSTFAMDVYFRKEEGRWVPAWLVYAGNHDGFPNWEFYADKQPLVQHDARKAGYGPTSMIGAANVKHSAVCERVGVTWRCE